MTLDDEEFRSAALAAQPLSARTTYESELLEKLKANDTDAFDRFVDIYSGDVFSLLYRLTENADDAAELTQETFLNAYRSIGRFRGDSGLKTWLFRIAVNESRNRFRWWKRRKRERTFSLDAVIGDSEMTRITALALKNRSVGFSGLVR